MNILEALKSTHLFGNLEAFHDLTTWRAWIVLLKATYGLPMTHAELAIFCEYSGRDYPLPTSRGDRHVSGRVSLDARRMTSAARWHATIGAAARPRASS